METNGDSLSLVSPGVDCLLVLSELLYVVGTMPSDHLVYIVVRFQLLLSMMIYSDLSVRETVYVRLYASGGNELINCIYKCKNQMKGDRECNKKLPIVQLNDHMYPRPYIIFDPKAVIET